MEYLSLFIDRLAAVLSILDIHKRKVNRKTKAAVDNVL